MDLILVVLNGRTTSEGLSQRYLDSIKLFNYGFNNYSLVKLQNEGNIADKITISNASKSDNHMDLVCEDSISALVSNDDASNQFLPIITINDNIEAPITKGDVLGKITYEIDGTTYSSNLLASRDMEATDFFKSLSSMGKTILKLVLALVVLYILLMIFKNYNKPKKRKRTY